MQRGLFIVIEGIDGSGKATQTKLLAERLTEAGHAVRHVSFPRYDQPSSYFVREYLKDSFGPKGDIKAHAASIFYALDRFDASREIRQALEAGEIVIADRFTGSNLAHQGAKLANAEERRGFYMWADNLEFYVLQIPRPDLNIILRVPAEVSVSQIEKRRDTVDASRKLDANETNMTHQSAAGRVYEELAQLFPRDFTIVDCVRSGSTLNIEQIASLVWAKAEPILPEPTPTKSKHVPARIAAPKATATDVNQMTTTSMLSVLVGRATKGSTLQSLNSLQSLTRYYVPDGLDETVRQKYIVALDEILNTRGSMAKKLRRHLEKLAPAPEDIDQLISQALIAITPLAMMVGDDDRVPVSDVHPPTSPLAELAASKLPTNHTGQSEPLTLVSYWPRNELDLLPELLYQYSDQPLTIIREQVSKWPYEQKAAALRTAVASYIDNADAGPLDQVRYGWDVVSPLTDLWELARQSNTISMSFQSPSPRLGYDMPEIIGQAGLTDEFEHCFDLSLELYSQLQAENASDAQYAVLFGHNVRSIIQLNLRQLSTMTGELSEQFRATASQVHSLIAQAVAASTNDQQVKASAVDH